MSLPHECRCGICGTEFPLLPQTLDPAGVGAFNRSYGAKTLASAILKIAPEQAKQIADRWEQLQADEHQALDDFLAILRGAHSAGAPRE